MAKRASGGKGNGGLLNSGNPGAGIGATPSVVRARYREIAMARMKALNASFDACEKILDSKRSPDKKMAAVDRVTKLHDVVGRLGGVASVSLTDGEGNDLTLPPMIIEMTTTKPETPP